MYIFKDGSLVLEHGTDGIIGTIGTCPWASDSNFENLGLYSGTKYEKIYNETVHVMSNFLESWDRAKDESPELLLGLNEPGLFSSYGYDLMYLFAHAMTKYHNQYGIPSNRDGYDIIALREILIKTTFIGLTGNVSLNSDGDRINVY